MTKRCKIEQTGIVRQKKNLGIPTQPRRPARSKAPIRPLEVQIFNLLGTSLHFPISFLLISHYSRALLTTLLGAFAAFGAALASFLAHEAAAQCSQTCA